MWICEWQGFGKERRDDDVDEDDDEKGEDQWIK